MNAPEEARKIDPKLKHFSNQVIQEVIDSLYTLAQLGIESYLKLKQQSSQVGGNSKT